MENNINKKEIEEKLSYEFGGATSFEYSGGFGEYLARVTFVHTDFDPTEYILTENYYLEICNWDSQDDDGLAVASFYILDRIQPRDGDFDDFVTEI